MREVTTTENTKQRAAHLCFTKATTVVAFALRSGCGHLRPAPPSRRLAQAAHADMHVKPSQPASRTLCVGIRRGYVYTGTALCSPWLCPIGPSSSTFTLFVRECSSPTARSSFGSFATSNTASSRVFTCRRIHTVHTLQYLLLGPTKFLSVFCVCAPPLIGRGRVPTSAHTAPIHAAGALARSLPPKEKHLSTQTTQPALVQIKSGSSRCRDNGWRTKGFGSAWLVVGIQTNNTLECVAWTSSASSSFVHARLTTEGPRDQQKTKRSAELLGFELRLNSATAFQVSKEQGKKKSFTLTHPPPSSFHLRSVCLPNTQLTHFSVLAATNWPRSGIRA